MTQWYEEKKQKQGIWTYPGLVEMIKNDGWTLTEFVNQAMQEYLGVEDPGIKVRHEKLQKIVPELKVLRPGKTYSGSGTGVRKFGQEDPEYLVLRQQELMALGAALQSHSQYSKIEHDLLLREPSEDDTWEVVAADLETHGFRYSSDEVWNRAIDWYWNGRAKS